MKAGPAQMVILYEGPPKLELVKPLPERLARALPLGRVLNEVVSYSAEAWERLARATGHYRLGAKTLELLREDAERIAQSVEGEQNALLWRLGVKWGHRVREGYLCHRQALLFLMGGAERIRSWRAGEPWDLEAVQDKLKAAILRGYDTNVDLSSKSVTLVSKVPAVARSGVTIPRTAAPPLVVR